MTSIKASDSLQSVLTSDPGGLRVVVEALTTPRLLHEINTIHWKFARLIPQFTQLVILKVSSCSFPIGLDRLDVDSLHFILGQVKIVTICAVKPNGVLSLAVAKAVTGHAFAREDLGQILPFVKQIYQVLRTIEDVGLVGLTFCHCFDFSLAYVIWLESWLRHR